MEMDSTPARPKDPQPDRGCFGKTEGQSQADGCFPQEEPRATTYTFPAHQENLGTSYEFPQYQEKETIFYKEGYHPNGRYEGAPYHHVNSKGDKNPGPVDGQSALDNSILIKDTSPRRIGISQGQIVILDKTNEGVYHGHVRDWGELDESMQRKLIKEGLTNQKGKIIKNDR
jgi:hypothetical protein